MKSRHHSRLIKQVNNVIKDLDSFLLPNLMIARELLMINKATYSLFHMQREIKCASFPVMEQKSFLNLIVQRSSLMAPDRSYEKIGLALGFQSNH